TRGIRRRSRSPARPSARCSPPGRRSLGGRGSLDRRPGLRRGVDQPVEQRAVAGDRHVLEPALHEQVVQAPGVALHDHVGILDGPGPGGAVDERRDLVADPELEAAARRDRRQQDVEGILEPPRIELVLVGRRAEREEAPERELAHHRPEPLPVLRELVHARGGRRRQRAPGDDPVRLEVAQAGGEDVGADTGQVVDEVRVPLRAVHQLADDEQRPALADQVERVSNRAVLVVALSHRTQCSRSACCCEALTCKRQVDAASVQALRTTTETKGLPMVTSERRKWLALALLSVVQFMVVLDIAIVNVALPSIKDDLGFSQENLQWVISAYALVFGGFLLLGGRAADLIGRRRIFLIGIAVFTAASLLAGLAWSEGSLIGARSLQGLGAAIISPAALSILSTTFTEG